jgi:D-serine deaminase-like pyridoxal phosphate-dependent protein
MRSAQRRCVPQLHDSLATYSRPAHAGIVAGLAGRPCNITTAAKLVEGTGAKLRPHFKSHKCVPITLEQLAAGNCAGITAATVDEASALVAGGIYDVLVANQIVVPYKVSRLVQLAKRATIRVSVASQQDTQTIAAEAQREGVQLGVLVEIEVGHLRWGVAPGKKASGDNAVPALRWVASLSRRWRSHP